MESAMSKDSDAGPANEGVTPGTSGDERAAEPGAPAGSAAGGREQSPATTPGPGAADNAEGSRPVDLDAVRDRAS
jgi:hypothetical protein